MLQRAGVRLQAAREARGLTIEDAARSTRIRPQQLRDLENDDYGNFPNPTYAKSFLTQYARYLGVDVSQERETFDVSHGHTYTMLSRRLLPQAEMVSGHGPSRGLGSGRNSREPSFLPRALVPLAIIGLIMFGLLALFAVKLMLDVNRSVAKTIEPSATPGEETTTPAQPDAPSQTSNTTDTRPIGEIVRPATRMTGQIPTRPSVSPATPGAVEVRRAIPVEEDEGALVRRSDP